MKKVLVAHNCGEPHDKALKVAVDLADQMGAHLTVVTVVLELNIAELADADKRRVLDASRDESRIAVKRALAPRDMNAHEIDFIVEYGSVVEKVLEVIKREDADMLIVGSHGRHGAARVLLGSISSKLVDMAPCPVLVVK